MKKLKKLLIVVVAIVVIAFIWKVYNGNRVRNTTPGGSEYTEITWPDSTAGQMLPVPEDLSAGYILSDSDTDLYVYLGKVSQEDYNNYVDKCKENGFNIDYDSGNDQYDAYNTDGYSLSINYDSDRRMMTISLNPPVETTTTPEATPEPAETAETPDETTTEEPSTDDTSSEEVDPDFKATMDSYETTINNYCDFMEKYNNAGPEDTAAMLADYTSYLQQYTETIDALNSIDEDSLSAADLAYYIEVNGRISQRLLEVGQSME